jgi:hypothetical protein
MLCSVGLAVLSDTQTRMDAAVGGRRSGCVAAAGVALQAGGHRFDPDTLHSTKALLSGAFL